MAEPTVIDHAALSETLDDLLASVVVNADLARGARHLHALLNDELDEAVALLERNDRVLAPLVMLTTARIAACFFWDFMTLLAGRRQQALGRREGAARFFNLPHGGEYARVGLL